MNVLIAPDSFKGGPSAAQVAEHIATGWRRRRPGDDVVCVPMADGGEGTMDALARQEGMARLVSVAGITGPNGDKLSASYLEMSDNVVVVEVAQAAGLPLMPEPDVLRATTRGVGELLREALRSGASRIVVAAGGSATCDGGAGALQALGARIADGEGVEVGPGGGCLERITVVDLQGCLGPPAGGATVLVDVDNPLYGHDGAAAIFGPQKGASQEDVETLDRGLERLAALLGGCPEAAGAGAAGGLGFGLAAAWGATLAVGASYVADALRLDERIDEADLIVTGEGRFDATSLRGKVCGEVIRRGMQRGVPIAVVAGSLDAVAARDASLPLSLSELAGSQAASMKEPARYLQEAGAILADRRRVR